MTERVLDLDKFWDWFVFFRDHTSSVRIDGIQYTLGSPAPSRFRGYDGDRFKIKFHDGREVVTNNLWYNGVIPTEYREELPDNARFIK